VSAASVQALVLAAGKGTRTRSQKAKALLPVFELPLLEHVLRAVAGVGADPVAVVVGHQAAEVEAAFAGRGLAFVRQDPPLGTGHAVRSARDVFSRHREATLLVVNGDLPLLRRSTLESLLAAHREARAAATLLSVVLDDPAAYGRVLRAGDGHVRAIVEARDASPEERAVREINVGVYAFETGPLAVALDGLTARNAQSEYYLTDVIALLVAAGHATRAVIAPDAAEGLGVNTLAELADATRRLRERRLLELMEAGVRVEDPTTTFVGPDAQVEPDAVLRPFTLLEGKSLVRTGAVIGPGTRLENAEVGRDAQVLDHCLLRECVVEAGASIGPFAHIRPESRIGEGAKVGNFVELKKTHLRAGAKAPHLTYLGDATVGEKANIGAGTITCNYDGQAKHPTRIGTGAFIGSNSTLVAPVAVGDKAYVAAGSAITQDVPPDALALGRSRQVVKADWARRRREAKAAAAAGRPEETPAKG
jgi:bifunctional UDP-N-acetylglucosamine pyrophosphorylase / glucosamine-1-phosphate N-acetyltransferase